VNDTQIFCCRRAHGCLATNSGQIYKLNYITGNL